MTHDDAAKLDLLPCPFCGSDDVSESIGTQRDKDGHEIQWPYIDCGQCRASAEPDVWNRRAISSALSAQGELPEEPKRWIMNHTNMGLVQREESAFGNYVEGKSYDALRAHATRAHSGTPVPAAPSDRKQEDSDAKFWNRYDGPMPSDLLARVMGQLSKLTRRAGVSPEEREGSQDVMGDLMMWATEMRASAVPRKQEAGLVEPDDYRGQQAAAWRGVVKALHRYAPGWLEVKGTGAECAAHAIKQLSDARSESSASAEGWIPVNDGQNPIFHVHWMTPPAAPKDKP